MQNLTPKQEIAYQLTKELIKAGITTNEAAKTAVECSETIVNSDKPKIGFVKP